MENGQFWLAYQCFFTAFKYCDEVRSVLALPALKKAMLARMLTNESTCPLSDTTKLASDPRIVKTVAYVKWLKSTNFSGEGDIQRRTR